MYLYIGCSYDHIHIWCLLGYNTILTQYVALTPSPMCHLQSYSPLQSFKKQTVFLNVEYLSMANCLDCNLAI